MEEISKEQKWQLLKVSGGLVLAILIAVYLLYNGWNDTQLILTFIFGGILGWIAGILFSPKSDEEGKSFSDFRTGIASFLGGIVISKIEQYIGPPMEILFQTPGKLPDHLIEYILYFCIAFGLGILLPFVGRKSDDIFDIYKQVKAGDALEGRD